MELRIVGIFTYNERPLRILDARCQWLLPFIGNVGKGSNPEVAEIG